MKTFKEVSDLYDQILNEEVDVDGVTMSPEDAHREVCVLMLQRHGDAIRDLEEKLFAEVYGDDTPIEAINGRHDVTVEEWYALKCWIDDGE